jgi:hypothetical protein
MDYEKRSRRKRDVAERAAYRDSMYSCCRIIGCSKPTTAAAGTGLDRLYCRSHGDHFDRHGSYTKRSYTAVDLRPHRKAAESWLQAHQDDRRVQLSVLAVEGLYRRAGPVVEAFRLRGLVPERRAWAVWARVREGKVDPKIPLTVWLAVELAIAADAQADRKSEFKRVQAAKVLHRVAGGSHRRWVRQDAHGRQVVQELHRYGHSRGLVLRYVGEQLERAAELLVPAMTTAGQAA